MHKEKKKKLAEEGENQFINFSQKRGPGEEGRLKKAHAQ